MPNPKQLTERLFQSPSKYIQGPNAIKNAGKYLAGLGKAPLLTSDDLVYKMTKSMFESLPELQAAHSAAKAIDVHKAAEGMPVPLHPGAARYLKEKGIPVPTP